MDGRLIALAYRMLGTMADAEDVLQDAYIRLQNQPAPPRNEEAYLFRVVANLSVDRLRHAKVQRSAYQGPWLPEPVADASEVAELAEDLSLGFMFMLERLTPAERVVFVLREGFDFAFDEIGAVLGVSADAARQRMRRAKRRLSKAPPTSTPVGEQHALLDQLMMAVAQDDVEQLVALLHPEAVAYTDGGGVVSAAIVPVTDPRRIAQVTLHLVRRGEAEGDFQMERLESGGGVLLVVRQGGAVHSVTQVTGEDGLVRQLFVMRNPEKLSAFA